MPLIAWHAIHRKTRHIFGYIISSFVIVAFRELYLVAEHFGHRAFESCGSASGYNYWARSISPCRNKQLCECSFYMQLSCRCCLRRRSNRNFLWNSFPWESLPRKKFSARMRRVIFHHEPVSLRSSGKIRAVRSSMKHTVPHECTCKARMG